MDKAVKPAPIAVPEAALSDLKARLDLVRWPEAATAPGWAQGVPLDYLQDIVDDWRHRYDWRRCEAALNALEPFETTIQGVKIHFLHSRSRHAEAKPLIMTHGWPGSVVEFLKAAPMLTDPTAHGGAAADAFHLILPTIPGYGFSGKPAEAGWSVERVAEAWAELMRRLGYGRYVAQGGDWGSVISTHLATIAPEACAAAHVNLLWVPPATDAFPDVTEAEQAALDQAKYHRRQGMGYSWEQMSRPQTIGYSLADSPVGQAAWILEKFYEWTDCDGAPENVLSRDELLDTVMMYWLTRSGASSARLYWESFGARRTEAVTAPIGYSAFPKEIARPSRRWAERRYKNLIYWNALEKGGHFAAFEQPAAFVRELRNCFGAVPL